MKATFVKFTRFDVLWQTGQRTIDIVGDRIAREPARNPRDNQLVVALYCTFRSESGDAIECCAQVMKVRRTRPEDLVVEVGPVQGLPDGGDYDHEEFVERARAIYRDEIVPYVLHGGRS